MTWSPQRLIFLLGTVLAFLVAAVNIHFMLTIGVSVGHLTGEVARLSSDVAVDSEAWAGDVRRFAVAIGGFILGAIIAGFTMLTPAFAVARPYGRSIIGIGITLLLASASSTFSLTLAVLLGAGACGFQNALTSRYRGMIVRTTHITGVLTDFGQMLGMRLSGQTVTPWKIIAPLGIAIAFALGALAGAWLHLNSPISPLLILGGTYVMAGILWMIFKRRVLLDDEALDAEPEQAV